MQKVFPLKSIFLLFFISILACTEDEPEFSTWFCSGDGNCVEVPNDPNGYATVEECAAQNGCYDPANPPRAEDLCNFLNFQTDKPCLVSFRIFRIDDENLPSETVQRGRITFFSDFRWKSSLIPRNGGGEITRSGPWLCGRNETVTLRNQGSNFGTVYFDEEDGYYKLGSSLATYWLSVSTQHTESCD